MALAGDAEELPPLPAEQESAWPTEHLAVAPLRRAVGVRWRRPAPAPPHSCDADGRGNGYGDDYNPRSPERRRRPPCVGARGVPHEDPIRGIDRSHARERRAGRQNDERNRERPEPGQQHAREGGARGEHARSAEPLRGVGGDRHEGRAQVRVVVKAPSDVLRARGESEHERER